MSTEEAKQHAEGEVVHPQVSGSTLSLGALIDALQVLAEQHGRALPTAVAWEGQLIRLSVHRISVESAQAGYVKLSRPLLVVDAEDANY